jgi:hypothetical protein
MMMSHHRLMMLILLMKMRQTWMMMIRRSKRLIPGRMKSQTWRKRMIHSWMTMVLNHKMKTLILQMMKEQTGMRKQTLMSHRWMMMLIPVMRREQRKKQTWMSHRWMTLIPVMKREQRMRRTLMSHR